MIYSVGCKQELRVTINIRRRWLLVVAPNVTNGPLPAANKCYCSTTQRALLGMAALPDKRMLYYLFHFETL